MELSLGKTKKEITQSERKNISMRKTIVIHPLNSGKKITRELLTAMRSNKKQILPLEKNIEKILGKKLKVSISKNTSFSWKMI